MSYLDLLKLAAPEAIVTLTALVVLVIGLTTSRGTVVAGVSVAMPKPVAAGTAAATRFCTLVGALGLIIATEAGLKYFLFGSTASAFTLFGLSFIYGMAGTTNLAAIAESLAAQFLSPLLFAGIVMTLVGFAFKIAAAPFHLWAPDAYQGGPVSSAAFIASGSQVACFVVLGKIVLVGFGPVHGSAEWHAMVAGWSPVLAVLAAFSILIGNLVALVQTNLRRLLAYSAVAHAGYTLLGIIAGGREGFSATLF